MSVASHANNPLALPLKQGLVCESVAFAWQVPKQVPLQSRCLIAVPFPHCTLHDQLLQEVQE